MKFLIVLALFASFLPPAFAETPSFPAPAADGIYPFSGVDPNLPDDDLRPLDRLIEKSRLFGIAESAHDSSNYKRMQFRLIRYLVEKKGFRILIVEDPILRSVPLQKYVARCPSSAPPISVLDDPMQEDGEIMRWLCRFNRAHPADKVVFRGEDIWDRPWELQALAEAYDARLRLGLAEELRTARARCWVHNVADWDAGRALIGKIAAAPDKRIPIADFDPCVRALKRMRVVANKALSSHPAKKRHYDLHTFLQTVQTLYAWQNVWNLIYRENDQAWSFRDQGQARNILSILAQEGRSRRAIWVTHVSHGTYLRSRSNWGGMTKNFTTGYYLDQVMGGDFRILAQSGYHIVGKADYVRPTSSDSMDLYFHDRRMPFVFVNNSGRFATSKTRWWLHNENNADYPNGVSLVPRENFDWTLFIDESPRGTPVLPWIDPFFG